VPVTVIVEDPAGVPPEGGGVDVGGGFEDGGGFEPGGCPVFEEVLVMAQLESSKVKSRSGATAQALAIIISNFCRPSMDRSSTAPARSIHAGPALGHGFTGALPGFRYAPTINDPAAVATPMAAF